MRKSLKSLTAVLAAIVTLMLIAATAGLAPAQAQELPAKPTGVSVAAGDRPDQAVVSWQADDEATLYRIGWVAFDKITAVQNANRPWLDAFAFTDVTNYGQTSHQLDGLLPNTQYAFIIGSLNIRFGGAAWSEWAYLTTADAAARCPDGGGGPSTPSATATPAPDATSTPAPAPVGIDYDTDNDGLIEIKSLAQLDAIRHDLDGDGAVRHGDAYSAAFPNAAAGMGCARRQCQGYELVANLDFDTNGNGQIDEGDVYWDEGDGWYPIGEINSPFQAVLEGNGHTIANLHIVWTDTTHIGMFRTTGEDAVIRNLTLTLVYVAGGAEKTGALAGINGGGIANSHVSGEVTGGAEVSGLAGYNTGAISESSSSTATTGTSDRIGRIGGLVGYNTSAITDSYATGDITGEAYAVGGLVGDNSYGTITGSRATGNVTSEGSGGGLVGYNTGTIITSYATGNVTGTSSVGGLAGYTRRGNITASYATGEVTGSSHVGGLIGSLENPGTVSNSYAIGNTSGRGRVGGLIGYALRGRATTCYAVGKVSGNADTGGLIGYYSRGLFPSSDYSARLSDSFWDTQTTGQPGRRSMGADGKTTREMQRPTGPSGIYAEWDPEYWDFGTSRQYPVLKYDGMDVAAQRQ